jgi:hypothetical protein
VNAPRPPPAASQRHCPCLPRYCIPARRVLLTRHHQGFPDSRPIPSLPLTCGPWPDQAPSGFPRAPHPAVTGHARHGGDRSQTLTRSHVTGIGRPPSDGLTPHVRPHVASTQQTITVPPHIAAKTRQKHDYPSAATAAPTTGPARRVLWIVCRHNDLDQIARILPPRLNDRSASVATITS